MVSSAAMPSKPRRSRPRWARRPPARRPARPPRPAARRPCRRRRRSPADRAACRARREDAVQPGDPDVDDELGARGRGSRAVSSASRATGRSEVPAQATTTSPPVGCGRLRRPGEEAGRPARGRRRAATSRTAAAAGSSSARVNSVRASAAAPRPASAIDGAAARGTCPRRRRPRRSRGGGPGRGRARRCPAAGSAASGRQRSRTWPTSGRVNAPDWMPLRSTTTNRKPAARTAAHELPRARRPSARGQFRRRQLDPGDVAVVAHPHVGEAELAQRRLGPLDLPRASPA